MRPWSIVLQCLLWWFVGQAVATLEDPSAGDRFTFEQLFEQVHSLEPHGKTMDEKLNTLVEQLNHANNVTGQLISIIRAMAGYWKPMIDTDKPVSYSHCGEIPETLKSDVYTIEPTPGYPVRVFCDQSHDGGGWAVIQNRVDGSVDFYRDWQAYSEGFGDLKREFWLGLQHIWRMTLLEPVELLVLLEDSTGNSSYAWYNQFELKSEMESYRISMLGNYSGTAGDGMRTSYDMMFSTFDNDNDGFGMGSCARNCSGAWWYSDCGHSNLNGKYTRSEKSEYHMTWDISWQSPLKSSRMMLRRKDINSETT